MEYIQNEGQAAVDSLGQRSQAIVDSIPTPKELLKSIKLPSKSNIKDSIVAQIVPGQMTNSELLQFLAPATISLPGLDLDSLLQIGFVTEIKDVLAKVDSKEERQALADKYYDNYVERNIDRYKDAIARINTSFDASKKKLETLLKRVQSSIARIANPPVVGPVSPNPTRTLQDYIDLKQQVETELSSIIVSMVDIITIAQVIGYELPIEFDLTAQTIGSVKKAIELIPV